jgi:hypothetical protein
MGILFMYRACLGMLVLSSGRGIRAGMRVPADEHGFL